MNVIVGLSYIFIGVSGLYQIWQTFIGVSMGLEVFRMKHDRSAFFVDVLIALLGTLLFVISALAIFTGITTLIGGVL